MDSRSDFLGGHAIWEKQTKLFFERNAAALERFLANPYSEANLSELMDHFKASVKTQQTAFDFMPQGNGKHLSSYYAALLSMTTETIGLLHKQMRARAKKKTLPQNFREFYELWLECGEEIYQQWLKSDKIMSAFSAMINEMFSTESSTT